MQLPWQQIVLVYSANCLCYSELCTEGANEGVAGTRGRQWCQFRVGGPLSGKLCSCSHAIIIILTVSLIIVYMYVCIQGIKAEEIGEKSDVIRATE